MLRSTVGFWALRGARGGATAPDSANAILQSALPELMSVLAPARVESAVMVEESRGQLSLDIDVSTPDDVRLC